MTTVAWFHCFAGIAGDMALGSLLDAGAELDEVRALLGRLPISGWSLDVDDVRRAGIGATRAIVGAEETSIVRTHSHIIGLIEEARLPVRVRDRSLAVFGALARAEAHVHRRPVNQIHFHEVGALDAIVDIVGTSAALEVLGVDTIASSAVATGTGMVRTAHGLLPNPAPAVVQLLRGAPTYGRDVSVELTTPTGAAILAALATSWGHLPSMQLETSGFGAGSRELDGLPNLTQVVVGSHAGPDRFVGPPESGQPLVLLEANVDDATGEVLAHALAAVFEAGAADAWITPVLMKKGRPGHVVSALVDVAKAGEVADVVISETGSLGVRGTTVDRWAASRSDAAVEVEGRMLRMKVSPGRAKAEA
ncbi:MAG TPA: nickel pincer cofactor biosynthesis protein LarC, partial [Acidimicrobiales bacterium]|nr:nickel pincer cofactor biosynthesis protein LarC [Acidimicrobiales bacterium]